MPSTPKLPPEASTLGLAIRFFRQRRGLSLRELAAMLEVSAPFLSDVEHDRRRPRDLRPLARALQVPEATLSSLDARMPADLKAWIEKNPDVVGFLRELKESGRDVREVRLLFADRKHRGA